jgi:hypothetical protein
MMSADSLASDGRIDGNADIGGLERGTIVDAVAEKADHVPLAVQGLNDAFLLRRGQLGEHRRAFRDVGELFLRHGVDARAERISPGSSFTSRQTDTEIDHPAVCDPGAQRENGRSVHISVSHCGRRRGGGLGWSSRLRRLRHHGLR